MYYSIEGDLYEYVLRSKAFKEDVFYDIFKLDLYNDRVYIVGFTHDFYEYVATHEHHGLPIEIVVDGKNIGINLDRLAYEHEYISDYMFLSIKLCIIKLDVLTPSYFIHKDYHKAIDFIRLITLGDTVEIKTNSFVKMHFIEVRGNKVLRVEKDSFLDCAVDYLYFPSCESIYFGNIMNMHRLNRYVFSKNCKLLEAGLSGNDYIHPHLLKLLKLDDFEYLSLDYFDYLVTQPNFFEGNKKICLNKLEVILNSGNHEYYSRKSKINGDDIVVPSNIEFKKLKNVFGPFNHYIFKKQCIFDKLEYMNNLLFEDCMIQELVFLNLRVLKPSYFWNCKIKVLKINKDCFIYDMDKLREFIGEIVKI